MRPTVTYALVMALCDAVFSVDPNHAPHRVSLARNDRAGVSIRLVTFV